MIKNTKRRFIAAAICAVTLTSWASPAPAEAPSLLPVQMVLTNAAGTPVSGLHHFTFSLYTTETFGSSVFDETIAMEIEGGNVLAYLGEVEQLDLDLFRQHDELWLQITIDGAEIIQPRFRLASVPYAAHAKYCGEAATLSAEASADFTYTAGNGLTMADNAISIDPTVTQQRVVGSCSSGQKMTAIAANGSVTCATDANTTYTAGSGLALSGTTLSVKSSGVTASHLAADSVGTSELQNVGLRCTHPFARASVAAGARGRLSSPSCPAGTTLTGGGCYTDFARGALTYSTPNGSNWYCATEPLSAADALVAYAVCCGLP